MIYVGSYFQFSIVRSCCIILSHSHILSLPIPLCPPPACLHYLWQKCHFITTFRACYRSNITGTNFSSHTATQGRAAVSGSNEVRLYRLHHWVYGNFHHTAMTAHLWEFNSPSHWNMKCQSLTLWWIRVSVLGEKEIYECFWRTASAKNVCLTQVIS